jgi:hypothetical protein
VEEKQAGQHFIRVEGDDFMTLEFHGLITAADMAAILQEYDARLLAQGRLFVLCNMSEAGDMMPEARATAKRRPKGLPWSYIAYVGASFGKRVVIDMLMRAIAVLSRVMTTHRFFDNEAEARAWLLEMRSAHGRQPAAPSRP